MPEVCSIISHPELRRHRSCVEGGLVLAVIGRCALIVWLGVGGGRIQRVEVIEKENKDFYSIAEKEVSFKEYEIAKIITEVFLSKPF